MTDRTAMRRTSSASPIGSLLWSAEVGGEWEITDELSIGADAYYSRLADEIFYNALSHVNENSADDTVRWGGDAHLAWERDKVAGLSLGASYVKATFGGGEFGHNLIPLVPETTVSANGRVWIWDACSVFGGYRFQSDMYSGSDFGNAFYEF